MKTLARAVLAFEPIILIVVTGAFWFDNPARVNFLPLLLLPMLARLILYRRLWLNVALNFWFYLFLGLCAINTYVAQLDPARPPYTWGWYQIGRPAMGVALALSLMSIAYERRRGDVLAWAGVLVGLLVGILGLTSAQFIVKSDQLYWIIDHLPRITTFPGAEGGFNVNEIGGAMAFFAPLAAGIAIYEWRRKRSPLLIGLSTLTFGILMLALLLGQSRLALIGVVVTLAVVIYLLTPAGRVRILALAGLMLFAALEVSIVTQVFQPPAEATENIQRDQSSFSQRPEIWNAAITLIRENPLTGYGLNQFRRREVRDTYVPNFAMVIIPHAHNEVLQVGADLGLPGMFVYIAWHLTLALMLWRAWRRGDLFVKTLAVSAAGGLAAHAIFGVGDAITLFDRFTFAYWLLVGLAASAYVLTLPPPDKGLVKFQE